MIAERVGDCLAWRFTIDNLPVRIFLSERPDVPAFTRVQRFCGEIGVLQAAR